MKTKAAAGDVDSSRSPAAEAGRDGTLAKASSREQLPGAGRIDLLISSVA